MFGVNVKKQKINWSSAGSSPKSKFQLYISHRSLWMIHTVAANHPPFESVRLMAQARGF